MAVARTPAIRARVLPHEEVRRFALALDRLKKTRPPHVAFVGRRGHTGASAARHPKAMDDLSLGRSGTVLDPRISPQPSAGSSSPTIMDMISLLTVS